MTQSYGPPTRVVGRTSADVATVAYAYNEAGWLASIGPAPGYVTSITYDARGQRTQIQYANGVTSTRTYSPTTFNQQSLSTSGPGGALQNLTYGYDPVGNVIQIT